MRILMRDALLRRLLCEDVAAARDGAADSVASGC